MQPNFKGNKKNQNFGEKSIRKAFFENQLKTNKEFKNHLDDYFNFFLKNKSGAGNQYKKVILPKGAADAVFWLSPDPKRKFSRISPYSTLPAHGQARPRFVNWQTGEPMSSRSKPPEHRAAPILDAAAAQIFRTCIEIKNR